MICEICKNYFDGHSNQLYCSDPCYKKAMQKRDYRLRHGTERPDNMDNEKIEKCSCGSCHCRPVEDSGMIYVLCFNCGKHGKKIGYYGKYDLMIEKQAIREWNKEHKR